ncbi:MAG: histidine phosphatase family protein [Vicinamibacterales bacterium]
MTAPSRFGAGRRLILVRHSVSEIRRDVPSAEWRLSAEGLARARAFARRLHPSGSTAVFTSAEPKAAETARALAAEWGLAVEEVPGLHEHERPEARLLSREAFEQRIRELFDRPNEVAFGAETAEEARRRFTTALMPIVARAEGDVVVVTHGTVMSLFVADATGAEPFAFWKRQEMPCAVTLRLPELTLEGATFLTDRSGRLQPPS